MTDTRPTCACVVNCEGFISQGQACKVLPFRDWGDPLAPADAEAMPEWQAENDRPLKRRSEAERVMGTALLLAIVVIVAGAFLG